MKKKKPAAPRLPNKLLISGVAGILVGGVLLLWNLGYLTRVARLWPVPFIILGLVFLYLAWPRKRSDNWIIPGMVLTLGGVAALISTTVLSAESVARVWPLFMLVTGLSLIPFGYRKKGSARMAITIPGLFISLLAILFLPFSIHHEEGGFAAFVGKWWPMILVIIGAVLVVSFFSFRKPSSKV